MMEISNSKSKLTKRQQQIVALVSAGISNKEIGRPLSVTEGTVKIHLHAIYSKLRIPNRTMRALLAHQIRSAKTPEGHRVEPTKSRAKRSTFRKARAKQNSRDRARLPAEKASTPGDQ